MQVFGRRYLAGRLPLCGRFTETDGLRFKVKGDRGVRRNYPSTIASQRNG